MLPPNIPSKPPSVEALFRFRVLSELLARVQRGESLANAVAGVATGSHMTLNRDLRKVSPRTLYRWLEDFDDDRDLAKLEPASRQRTKSSIVIAPRLLDFLAIEKERDIGASIPELLRRARVQGIIAQAEKIDRSTVYRACQRLNIPVLRRRRGHLRDSRRFAYPHRMDLVLSDGKHFRAGATRARRVAMFFLDDSSRFGLHVVVGPSESKALFLRGLYGSIQHHGVSDIYYLDHGAGFIADDTVTVIQQIDSLLIHGEKAYPEGHGKIERFHRTAIAACLRNLDRRPDIDPDCGALELRLAHWLRETYNHTPHESLDDGPELKSPWARFSTDEKPLRFPESMEKLSEKFLVQLRRKVSADHIVSVDGVALETPRGLAGSWIMTYRQVLDGTVHVLHEGRLVRLHPVDLVANAHDRRGAAVTPPETIDHPLPKSAADISFSRDFHPITDADGNFNVPNPTLNPKE